MHVTLPDGTRAIVRGNFPRPMKCATCGGPADLVCDWKIGTETVDGVTSVLTCDTQICKDCTYKPAPGKDLCRYHAGAWKRRLEAKKAKPF